MRKTDKAAISALFLSQIPRVSRGLHTHTHTDDIYLGRVGIGGVVILHEKGLIKIIWSNSCLVGTFIEIE